MITISKYIIIVCTIALQVACSSYADRELKNFDERKRIGTALTKKHYPTFSRAEEYVSRIGKKLIIVSDMPQANYQFRLTQDADAAIDINNNIINIDQQFLAQLSDEAELAAVLSYAIVQIQSPTANFIGKERQSITYLYRAGYDPYAAIDIQEKTMTAKIPLIHPEFVPSLSTIQESRAFAKKFPKGLTRGAKSFNKNCCPLS